jgi:Ca-activated chloride channel homolog
MQAKLRPKILLRAVLLVALVGASAWAWGSAGGSFANLWLTPDQQGARLMARQQYAEAAKHFCDPLWQGAAKYRDGQFKEAAAFARVDSPEAAFDRGNALVMAGKYMDAIVSYDRALQLCPDWHEARANRDLAEARHKMLELPKDDAGGTGEQLEAGEVVFDDRPQQSEDAKQVEVVSGGKLTDEQLQGLWLRRVQTKPADFLRAPRPVHPASSGDFLVGPEASAALAGDASDCDTGDGTRTRTQC